MTARAARLVAVLIAIAGLVDPTLTRGRQVRPALSVVMMDEHGQQAAMSLQSALAADYDVTLATASESAGAAACPASGGCVIVSSGAAPERVTAGADVIGAVKVAAEQARPVARVEPPARAHVSASSTVRVQLAAPVPRIDVFDGDVLVGSATDVAAGLHDVPWVPIAPGTRRLRVVAAGQTVDAGVTVDSDAVDVLFVEPEPTWQGTFVRRALEDDARFAVRGGTRVNPALAVARGAAPRVTEAALADVGAVVVTAPEGLASAEIGLLRDFVARRGGSLIVLLDQRPEGAIAGLLPPVAAERRDASPQRVGSLRATEWLEFQAVSDTTALATIGDSPVVVSRAMGRGRVVVSGALDAWRFRDDEGFAPFWTALAWQAAHAAGPPLRVVVEPPLVAVGQEAEVSVELQTMSEMPASLVADAHLECGEGRRVVRLWPDARPGAFVGRFQGEKPGSCELLVSADGRTAQTPILVAEELAPAPADSDALDRVIQAYGGVVVAAGHEGELAERVRDRLLPRREATPTRPMRAALWIVPFTCCLTLEWWLRRRAGMR